jgi:hypothetical protein
VASAREETPVIWKHRGPGSYNSCRDCLEFL